MTKLAIHNINTTEAMVTIPLGLKKSINWSLQAVYIGDWKVRL